MLGIDLGTGSTKAAVFDERGVMLGFGSTSHRVDHPVPGAAETDPSVWLTSVAAATRTALTQAGTTSVAAVGLSGQMHGVVFVAADGTTPRPAMLWPDTRAAAACRHYDRLGTADRTALANPVVPGMFGPLLAHALAGEPTLRTRLRWALSPKDWLRLVLTGQAATEPSDASATLLWDVPADRWSDATLRALDVPAGLLPPVVASAAAAGSLNAVGAELLGVARGTPVAAGAGDTAAAIHGSGLSAGASQLSIGTGAQIVVPLDDVRPTAVPVTHRYRRADATGWYAMAAIQNAGLALEWVRTLLTVTWEELLASLDAVAAGADGVTFHPYLTGERTPILDANVHGAWQGLSRHHGRAVLCRAALEGVAFALRDGLQALITEGVPVGPTRLVGGGSDDARWRRLLACALGRPLRCHRQAQTSVLGAARLGAAAVGLALPAADDPPLATIEPDRELVGELESAWSRWEAHRPLVVTENSLE
ncbi:FGGY family carbohydrate kinase [soil metagenome]